jgi:hypothetical protein
MQNAAPEGQARMYNKYTVVGRPASTTSASPQSTSASMRERAHARPTIGRKVGPNQAGARPRRVGQHTAVRSHAAVGRGIESRGPRSTIESEHDVAIGIYFPVQGMTADKYDDVIRKLEEAGAGTPAGRTYHCAFQGENGLNVFDVWDSQEAFDAFGEKLMPILADAGIDPGEPMISPVHNIIIG